MALTQLTQAAEQKLKIISQLLDNTSAKVGTTLLCSSKKLSDEHHKAIVTATLQDFLRTISSQTLVHQQKEEVLAALQYLLGLSSVKFMHEDIRRSLNELEGGPEQESEHEDDHDDQDQQGSSSVGEYLPTEDLDEDEAPSLSTSSNPKVSKRPSEDRPSSKGPAIKKRKPDAGLAGQAGSSHQNHPSSTCLSFKAFGAKACKVPVSIQVSETRYLYLGKHDDVEHEVAKRNIDLKDKARLSISSNTVSMVTHYVSHGEKKTHLTLLGHEELGKIYDDKECQR